MGLLLSILVVCVGVIELVTFYYDMKRHLVSPPICGDLSKISEGYIRELHEVKKRIINDLKNLEKDTNVSRIVTDVSLPASIFRLNSHEDIEVEYSKSLARSRSPSPRRFLVTEKDRDRCAVSDTSPRRFVVSEEAQIIKKSKSQSSIPEFLIQEQNKSPNQLRYVLKGHQGRSTSPIPLPRQFLVTEDQLSSVVFQEEVQEDFDALVRNEGDTGRSSSPYAPLNLPQAPNELFQNTSLSIVELDEDPNGPRSTTPSKVDVILESTNFNTTQYWTNKVLVEPCKKSSSLSASLRNHPRSVSSNVNKLLLQEPKVERVISKCELETNETASVGVLVDGALYDDNYLNSLDGVAKAKIKRSNSRKSSKRKNVKSSSSHVGEIPNFELIEDTSSAEKLRKACSTENFAISKLAETSETSSTENKPPEPFWVIL